MSRRPIGRCVVTKIAYDDLVGVAHDAGCMLQLLDQDVAYGLRMLVDIADGRSPTRRFSTRPPPSKQSIGCTTACASSPARFPRRVASRRRRRLRLVVPSMDWDAYVHLAFDEIRLAGAGSPQVSRRLQAALEDLLRGRTAGSPSGSRTPDRPAVIVDDRLDDTR